ncbi:MAG: ABC family ATPase [Methanosarcina spindle-shaped virus 1]
MRIAQRLRQKYEKRALAAEKEQVPMANLTTTVKKAKQFCQDNNQDWVTFIVGNEGSGKSTLASHICTLFDPEMDIGESMIYSFNEGKNSLLEFYQRYKDTPYKVAWYDEAVTVLFSLRHSSRDSVDAQELFKIKRASRHFDVIVSPSFWDVVPDIRERRIKSLLYCYITVSHPTNHKSIYHRKYAYYSREKIVQLSANKKAKYAFSSPKSLFALVKPDFIEEFPGMSEEIEAEYLRCKRQHRDAVLDRITGATTATKIAEIVPPAPAGLTKTEITQAVTKPKSRKKKPATETQT